MFTMIYKFYEKLFIWNKKYFIFYLCMRKLLKSKHAKIFYIKKNYRIIFDIRIYLVCDLAKNRKKNYKNCKFDVRIYLVCDLVENRKKL